MLLRADVDGNANNRIFRGESAHLQCRTRQSRESETRVKPCQCWRVLPLGGASVLTQSLLLWWRGGRAYSGRSAEFDFSIIRDGALPRSGQVCNSVTRLNDRWTCGGVGRVCGNASEGYEWKKYFTFVRWRGDQLDAVYHDFASLADFLTSHPSLRDRCPVALVTGCAPVSIYVLTGIASRVRLAHEVMTSMTSHYRWSIGIALNLVG